MLSLSIRVNAESTLVMLAFWWRENAATRVLVVCKYMGSSLN